jgi:hypothetical protein
MWEAVLSQRQAVGPLSTRPLPKEGCMYMRGRQKVNRVFGPGWFINSVVIREGWTGYIAISF